MTTAFDECNCVNSLTFLCTSNPSSWLLPPFPRFPSTVSTTLRQVQEYLGDYLPTASVRMCPSIRSHGPPDLTTWGHRKPEVGEHNVVKDHDRGQPPQRLQGPIQSSRARNTRHMKSQDK